MYDDYRAGREKVRHGGFGGWSADGVERHTYAICRCHTFGWDVRGDDVTPACCVCVPRSVEGGDGRSHNIMEGKQGGRGGGRG